MTSNPTTDVAPDSTPEPDPDANPSPTTGQIPAEDGEPDTLQALSVVLARFRRVAAEGAERLGATVDLSPGQVAALLAIDEGASNVSAVSQQCFTHVSNASRTIDSLVRDGLLDRARDPDDRRSVVLTPTEAGTRCVAHLHARRDRVMRSALADFSASDQDEFVTLLHRLMVGLEHAILGDESATPS